VHDCGVYAESSVVTVDGVVRLRPLVFVHCVLQCSDSELGVKQSDAIWFGQKRSPRRKI
jgi:hypothetical protein